VEPSTQTEDLAAGGLRGGGLVEVEGAGLPDEDQPDPAENDGGGQEKNGREVALRLHLDPTQSHRTRLNGAPSSCVGHPHPVLQIPPASASLGVGMTRLWGTVESHVSKSAKRGASGRVWANAMDEPEPPDCGAGLSL